VNKLALGSALLAAACGERSGEAPAFELRPVVQPTLARLEAELPALPAPPETDADVRERFEAVIGPLRGGNPELRELVIEDARALPPQGVELLARALLDPAEAELARTGVAEVLGALATPRALEALCAGLEGAHSPGLRAQCAYRLGLAGDDRVVPRLVLRLKYEKDFETVYWIADALARFHHLAGLDALLVLWSQASSAELRANAAHRLDTLAREHDLADVETLVASWRDGSLPARAAPSRALVLEGWRWIARLGEWNLRSVDDARFVLVGLEGWSVPLLAEALHEEEVYVRLHVAHVLERRGRRGVDAAATLEAALDEPRIAAVAASALGTLGATAAAPALERAASTSRDAELEIGATRALGVLRLERSVPVLQALFASAGAFDLRQAAAESLLAIQPSREALAFVRACLLDERADAGSAEFALGAWLAERAAEDPSAAAAFARWESLGVLSGQIPSESQVRERRQARHAVLSEPVAVDGVRTR
jgi:HEAT repeat protein